MEYTNHYLVAAFEARKTIVRLESELKAERERSADWRAKAAEHKLAADELRGQTWRPVSEAPQHVAVLACEPGCGMAVAKLVNGEWRDDHGSSFRPTHWMPLPPWPVLGLGDALRRMEESDRFIREQTAAARSLLESRADEAGRA